MIKGIKQGLGIFIGLFLSAIFAYSVSGTVKTWTTGETLTASDLNTTVQSLKTAVENASQLWEIIISMGGTATNYQYTRFLASGSNTTEVNTTMPRAGTVKSFNQKIASNTMDAACTLTLRKNGADTNISTAIPAGSTTTVTDADTVSFVAADTLGWRMQCTGATTGTISTAIQFEF